MPLHSYKRNFLYRFIIHFILLLFFYLSIWKSIHVSLSFILGDKNRDNGSAAAFPPHSVSAQQNMTEQMNQLIVPVAVLSHGAHPKNWDGLISLQVGLSGDRQLRQLQYIKKKNQKNCRETHLNNFTLQVKNVPDILTFCWCWLISTFHACSIV